MPGGGSPVHEYLRVADTQSIGAAVENLILRACELGLGSVWIGWVAIAAEEIKRLLGRPHEFVAAVALGYPAETPAVRPRKMLDEVVDWR